jgi:hypothetical protein
MSRLSEKTLELSITAQLTQRLGVANAIWFGLTQRQERLLGYDIASTVSGRLLVLQFKASSVIVHPRRYSTPRRKFSLPHQQLTRLQELAEEFPGSVYYVLPDIGSEAELAQNSDLVAQSWLLDVAALPVPFPIPTNVSQKHHAYIAPPACDIRSEPVEVRLLNQAESVGKLREAAADSREMVSWLRRAEFSFKGMRAYGLLLPS